MEDNLIGGNTEDQLIITKEAASYLSETARWAKFLAIVGFVMIGFMVVLALSIGTIMTVFMPEETEMGAMPVGMLTVLYLLIALLYFFPILYLYRFASRIQLALNSEDNDLLSGGLEQLKSCFKFMGIMMIVVLVFYAVGFLAAISMGVFMN